MTPRPRKDDKREKHLQVRLTEDEAQTIKDAAESVGLPVSQWVRLELLKAAKRQK